MNNNNLEKLLVRWKCCKWQQLRNSFSAVMLVDTEKVHPPVSKNTTGLDATSVLRQSFAVLRHLGTS